MKRIALSLMAATMGVVGGAAHAASENGGLMTVNGKLTSDTCDISGNGGGADFAVTLPTLSVTQLLAAGSTAGSTGFAIDLKNCTPEGGNVHAYWEPGVNTLSDGNLKNNGTATSVELQLVDYNGSPTAIDLSKADGSQNSRSVAISGGDAHMQFAAQYVSPAGRAGAGSVTTSVTYLVAYQ